MAKPHTLSIELGFLRLSWPKTAGVSEATDHLANPKASLEPAATTLHSTQASRLLRRMISKLLQPIAHLKGEQFWKAYWDMIQCHHIPWCIGILPGDVCLRNLMYTVEPASGENPAIESGLPASSSSSPCTSDSSPENDTQHPPFAKIQVKGIFNDFDLAGLIDSRTGNPVRMGFERTGTKPFMAYELSIPANTEESMLRKYRHDLESFAWVASYVCGCVQNGQGISAMPFDRWFTASFIQARAWKVMFGRFPASSYKPTKDFEWLSPLADKWIAEWEHLNRKLNHKSNRLPEEDDLDYLRRMVALAHEARMPFILPPMPWLTHYQKRCDLQFEENSHTTLLT